jgi:hypothetical protein
MNAADIFAIAAAFAVTAWFIKTVTAKDRDAERYVEDDNRVFFDEHGHWPDETPDDARRRAEQAAYNERIARADERD